MQFQCTVPVNVFICSAVCIGICLVSIGVTVMTGELVCHVFRWWRYCHSTGQVWNMSLAVIQ